MEKTIALNVTVNEAQLILAALSKLPFEAVYQTLLKLDAQVKAATAQPDADKKD